MARKTLPPSEIQVAPHWNWPAQNLEIRSISELRPYDKNPRTHSPFQVDQIARSMHQFGWTIPILIDDKGELIAGHGRVLSAKRLVDGGLVVKSKNGSDSEALPPMPAFAQAPCLVAKGWSAEQKKAYVIADNKLTLAGGWDEDLLRSELEDLQGLGFDLQLTGFDDAELDFIFKGWDADSKVVDNVDAELADLEALIRVRCPNATVSDVKAIIMKAIDGLAGVSVDG